jgi:catechol 2,3-dioxygenase-like lactoylglutathione lyase family enzyme
LAAVRIESFDHVALWVSNRDVAAAFAVDHLGLRVIERTDRFTLVGADARRGKLTLFDAEGERDPGLLAGIGLRVRDLEVALARLPASLAVERGESTAAFAGPEGLRLTLVEADLDVDADLDHVRFRVPDPDVSAQAFVALGLVPEKGRLRAGEGYVDLEAGAFAESERPLLNHLGFRVESAEEHIAEAERLGLPVADVVDAPNTIALFVWGPDRVKLEYVEHKPSFSLV